MIRVQREMFIVGAKLATSQDNQSKLQEGVSKSAGHGAAGDREIDELLEEHPLPNEFILPGETMGSAGLDVARSTVRRAEREAAAMDRQSLVPDPEILRYLNRLSDLLFVLARYHEAEQGKRAAPSRPGETVPLLSCLRFRSRRAGPRRGKLLSQMQAVVVLEPRPPRGMPRCSTTARY